MENALLRDDNAELHARIGELERRMPAPEKYALEPSLETVHAYLDRAGYAHQYSAGANHVHLEFSGKNTSFGVNVQHFASARLLFIATDDYLHLEKAGSTESVVLLLVQVAALNYELLFGKFQVNPESGEILLSVELPTRDGLGYDTFLQALEQLLHTADARYPELERAAAGLGL